MGQQAIKNGQKNAHCTLIWTIEDGSALLISKCTESPKFIAQTLEKTKWRLVLINLCFTKWMAVCLQREEDDGPDTIEIKFEVSFLAEDGSPLGVQTYKNRFKSKGKCCLTLFQDSDEVFFQRRAEFLPNGELTVRCRMWIAGTEMKKAETCFARSRLGVDRRSFVWAIREFSSLQRNQQRKRFVNPASNGSPQLILSLFLSENNGKDYVSIQIEQNDAKKHRCMLCKFSLLDSDGRTAHAEKMWAFIQVNRQQVCTLYEFFDKEEIISNKTFLLQNDVLCLRCEFLIEADPVWNGIELYRHLKLEDMNPKPTKLLEMYLRESDESCAVGCPFKKTLEDLYGEESLSDVSLRAGGRSFPAHKAILSARSPVFKAMFTQGTTEKTSKIVSIPDMKADTLARLLLYIYKNTIEELEWEAAMNLLRAADKYQLLELRKKCYFFLESNFSVTDDSSFLSLPVEESSREILFVDTVMTSSVLRNGKTLKKKILN